MSIIITHIRRHPVHLSILKLKQVLSKLQATSLLIQDKSRMWYKVITHIAKPTNKRSSSPCSGDKKSRSIAYKKYRAEVIHLLVSTNRQTLLGKGFSAPNFDDDMLPSPLEITTNTWLCRQKHRWAQSAMDRWIDTDTIDRYYRSILFPITTEGGQRR
jgi:hypothetical protein